MQNCYYNHLHMHIILTYFKKLCKTFVRHIFLMLYLLMKSDIVGVITIANSFIFWEDAIIFNVYFYISQADIAKVSKKY